MRRKGRYPVPKLAHRTVAEVIRLLYLKSIMKIPIGLVLLLLFGALPCFAQGACPAGAPVSGNHCYFISSAAGSDSNNGTTESTPWAHAPGMVSCSAKCAAVTPTGGEAFILRGCDTWNMAAMGAQWNLEYSGSAGNLIYYGGFDQTWYNSSTCPNGWNRPILSGEGTWPGSSTAGNAQQFVILYGASYWRMAWIEFTGMYWDKAVNITPAYISPGQATHFEIDHNYMHGWSSNITTTCSSFCGDPILLYAGGSGSGANFGRVDHNVLSGADTPFQNQATGIGGNFTNSQIDHNWLEYMDSGFGGGTYFVVDDNTFNYTGLFPVGGALESHNNVFEQNGDPASGSLMYNNLIIHSSTYPASVVTDLSPPRGTTSYFWGNVNADFKATGGTDPMQCAPYNDNTADAGTCVFFNNTFECGGDTGLNAPPNRPCFDAAGGVGLYANYNHLISAFTPSLLVHCKDVCAFITSTPSPNLNQSLSAANGQGYTFATYFAPRSGSGATIAAGYSPSDLVGLCNTIASVDTIGAGAGTACEQSTTAGVKLLTSPYYSVGGSTLTPVARLTSGSTNNDAGAFQFNSGVAAAPAPPMGLTAMVQ